MGYSSGKSYWKGNIEDKGGITITNTNRFIGDTYRIRGSITTSPGTGTAYDPVTGVNGTSVFGYNNPHSFDGITGAKLALAAGYAITTGLYRSGARVDSDYAKANYFYFTVNSSSYYYSYYYY